MRYSCARFGLLVSLLIASSASAVTMAWTPIGNPGNACDSSDPYQYVPGCYGAVPYAYSIGTYEVTNAQYAEFLNAKAKSDPLGLYDANMADVQQQGGITRSGVTGSYSYAVPSGRGALPVNFVSFYDTLRFANWMNNGQGSGDTETGAYTLLGGSATPTNGETVMRNAGATLLVPSEDEWFKAAYYDPTSSSYFDVPTGSNGVPNCSAPTASANSGNCSNNWEGGYISSGLTNVGSYPGSPSPYGTFDQGGNVAEWNEALIHVISGYTGRSIRGGRFDSAYYDFAAIRSYATQGWVSSSGSGFRLALIPGGFVPEPGTGLLVIAGLLGLACRRATRQ